MHRFTDRDIGALKQELSCVVLEIYIKNFDFTPYIENKMITWQQRDLISAEIQGKNAYGNINMDPVPSMLQPLIAIARQRVAENKETPLPPRSPKHSYNWDSVLEYVEYDDAYYRRRERDDYYYY